MDFYSDEKKEKKKKKVWRKWLSFSDALSKERNFF